MVIDPAAVFIICWTVRYVLIFCHANIKKIRHIYFFLNPSVFLVLPLVWYINNKECFFEVACYHKFNAKEVSDNKHFWKNTKLFFSEKGCYTTKVGFLGKDVKSGE